jgi:hypothetical protein
MLEDAFDDADSIWPLWMAGAIVMIEAGGMCQQKRVQFRLTNKNPQAFPDRASKPGRKWGEQIKMRWGGAV